MCHLYALLLSRPVDGAGATSERTRRVRRRCAEPGGGAGRSQSGLVEQIRYSVLCDEVYDLLAVLIGQAIPLEEERVGALSGHRGQRRARSP